MKIIRTIIFILVVIGLIWLIVLLLGKAFSVSDNNTVTVDRKALVTYANTNATTSMYIDGPVRVNQDHEAMRITVDRNQTKVERISGYENQVVAQQTFPSNINAYAVFLQSLDKANFSRSNIKNIPNDERGSCPLQNRTIFKLDDSGNEVVRSWTNSCGGGNMAADRATVRSLFLRQIPDKDMSAIMRGSQLSFR